MSTTHILDLRGLLLKTYHGSDDQSVSTADKQVSCWQAALVDFLDKHLIPILQTGAAPRQIIAVLDKGNTYRRNLWQGYKQKRREEVRDPALEQETKELQARVQDLLVYLGAKIMWVPGEEADDAIALLAQKLPGAKIIHTVDADLLALVDEHTQVLRGGKLYAQPALLGVEHSVPYSLVTLNKALVGDTSDGYSGVPKLGAKSWETLLEVYGESGLQWLAAVIDEDRPDLLKPFAAADQRMGLIYSQWPDARRGWLLASLHPDACYGSYRTNSGKTLPKRPEWRVRLPSRERVANVLSDALRMVTTAITFDAQMDQYLGHFESFFLTERLITADEAGELVKLLPEILASEVVAYDFESSDKLQHAPFRQASTKDFVDVLSQELAGVSINWGNNSQHSVYISFDHADTANLPMDWATWVLQTLASREDRCVVHNASFELTVALRNLGFMPRAPYDTVIMSSYVDENEESHLKMLSQRVLNYRQTSYAEVTKGRAMWEVPAVDVVSYGCDDSLVTAHLFDLFKTIMHLEGSWDFYDKYEVSPAADDVFSFVAGTRIDLDRLAELRAASAERREQAELALRTALAEHPGDERQAQQAATTLLSEWWVLEQYKYLDDPAGGQAAYQALWQRAWQACFYTPPVAITASKPFAATPTGINTVIALLDPRAPKLKSLSVKAIEQYDEVLADYLAPLSAIDRAVIDLRELANLLHGARQWLTPAKRTGNNYERLRDFCQGVLDEKAPVKVTASGSTLNFGSAPQMAQFLYGLLGLPIRRRSKVVEGTFRAKHGLSGSPATGLKAAAAAIVWDLQEGDWRIEVLNNYAVVCKEQQLESLYFKKYPLWVSPIDDRIHPQFRNCGTATRRPTGSNPNCYQIAKGSMRSMFPAGEGRVFVSLDFAGQELVVAACIAKDPVLLDAFTHNPRQDVHSLTASGIAPVLLPRLGIPWSGLMSYEQFLEGLHSPDEKVKAAYKTVRNRYAKSLLFSILYGSSAVGVAENLMIAKGEAERMVEALFGLYAKIPVWQQACSDYAKEHGYVLLPYGSRRHAEPELWSDERKLVSRQERQLSNSQIQGCLQAGSRVLTDKGLVPIEDTVGKAVSVWTGFKWAPATGLNRGECELLEIELESGIIVRCDTRHKLKGPDLQWHDVASLSAGDLVALPLATSRYGDFDPLEKYEMGWPFLLGYWLGDGYLSTRTCKSRAGSPYQRSTFSLCGGSKKVHLLVEMCEFLSDNGFSTTAQLGSKGRYDPLLKIELNKKADIRLLLDLGFSYSNFAEKRVPEVIWRSSKADQLQFLYGFALSDGARTKSPSWHTPNLPLLREIQTLLAANGVDSCMAETAFGHKLSTRLGNVSRKYPMSRIHLDVTSAPKIADGGDLCDTIVCRRVWKQGRVCSQRTAENMYRLYAPGVTEIYRYDEIREIRRLNDVGVTYTMSVDDELHQFVADGVIHKNTAAEILKVVRQSIFDANLRERYQMESLFEVYDEVTASVPVALSKEYILELAEIMRVTAPGFGVAMEVEASVGFTWGTQIEIGLPTPENIDQALQQLGTQP